MGTGCSSVIEHRSNADSPWCVWPEHHKGWTVKEAKFEEDEFGKVQTFDPVYIARGWNLYVLLGVFGGHETDNDEPRQFLPRRGPPSDMSAELSRHLYEWEDCDAEERMSWFSLDELRTASKTWNDYLVAQGEGPDDGDVTLRDRLAAAEECSAKNGGEVRMVYWFSS